ncbi:MAG: trimethylamine methyltransferase family protein [Actinomycetota bacterium]
MAIRPLKSIFNLDVLTDGQVEKIKQATLQVLDEVGVQIRSDEMLAELGKAGARTDDVSGNAYFSPELVNESLALAPRELHFGARDPENDLYLDGETSYLGVDGCAAEYLEWDTDIRRPSTKTDVATIARIADAIPQLSYIWQPVTAREEHVLSSPVHEVQAEWHNTTKHIMQMTAVNGDQARSLVEMATAIQGSNEELRKRPVLSAFQCSISPLTYDGGPLEAAKVYGAAGIPNGFMVMPITSATAAASVAGTLVGSNSEIIAGIVIHQLLNPGAPTFYGSCATMMDMRSGAAACGGPEDIFFQAANAQLAHSYSVPCIIGTFASGSKTHDWQTGSENGISGMASALGRADLCSGAGLLYGARVFSPVQMLLDADLFELIALFAEGYGFDEEQLAIDVIKNVGPGGHYLGEEHTLKHMRDFYYPAYYNRQMWEDWEEAGKPKPEEAARDKIREILETHVPEPLPDDISAEFDKIVARLDEKVRAEDEDWD